MLERNENYPATTKMSACWRIEANGGWTYVDACLADDVASYITKVLPRAVTYIVTHHDIAPDPPDELQYGSYAYRSEQVFALYKHDGGISLDQLCAQIKQRVEGFLGYPLLAFRDEYKLFRYFPITQEEFHRQTEYYKDEKTMKYWRMTMSFPKSKYQPSAMIASLRSRRGYLRNSIIKTIPVCRYPCYQREHAYACVGCVFTTDDEFTECSVRENISMCTRPFQTVHLDCSPISQFEYEWARQIAAI